MTVPTIGRSASAPWPTSPLDAAQRAFDLLNRAPATLAFDCRGRRGLPQRIVPLDELKRLLLSDATTPAVRDEVWRVLVVRARRDGPAWVVATVGIAMPGLKRKASRLTRGWHGDVADLESEMLTGFIERLGTLDIATPNVCRRLLDAGLRAVQRSRQHSEILDAIHLDGARSLPPARPWDHPDLVLARAVSAGVISAEDGLLISRTRLDELSLEEVAGGVGLPTSTAWDRRARAETLLARAIQAGDLSWVHLPSAG